MNRLLFLLALISPAFAEPRLHVPGHSITPDAEIEVILDKPACPAERIGKEAASKWLKITPAWPGKTIWKEANVLRFVPSAPPSIGTSYTFSLVGKHIHLDQSKVPKTQLGKFSTPDFQVEYVTLLERYSKEWSPRTSAVFLRFNDAVDPNKAAPFLVFKDASGKSIAAHTTRATFARLQHQGYLGKSFTQYFAESISGTSSEPQLSPEYELPNGLIVEPDSPLPVGKSWQLTILSGLPGAGAKLQRNGSRSIGNISPFTLEKSIARVVADQARRIVLDFSSKLPDQVPASMITLTPEIPDLQLEVHGDELHLLGDFTTHEQWHVGIDKSLSSRDGRPLVDKVTNRKLVFERLDPSLGLPSEDETQLAVGSRRYRISTINLESLHIRIKRLSGAELIRAQQGYRHYTGRGPDSEPLSPTTPIPYSLMGGETIAELEIPLGNAIDTSQLVVLDWNKILSGNKSPYQLGEPKELPGTTPGTTGSAAFFLDVVGTPHTLTQSKKTLLNQSLIQLTDIGLAWKISDTQSRIFAFSCLSGKPLPGVKIEIFGEDAKALSTFTTDASGLATIPRHGDDRHLRATLGDDQFSAVYDAALPTVGLWRFPVRYSWNEPPLVTRRVFLFTDRSLYRPAETVHLKGLVRRQNGNDIEPQPAAPARLSITNPTGLEILTRDLEISPDGSFNASFQLPAETVGHHRITVSWPDELTVAEEIENWSERGQAIANSRFGIALRVEEFRRNAFEISHKLTPPKIGASEVVLDLTATYYQGQAVAGGSGDSWTRISERNLYPERYRDFLFGDHRTPDFGYWMHYFGYRWGDDHGNRNSNSHSNEIKLSEEGMTRITAQLPESKFPMARSVTIQTTVTDANNQTLTKTSNALVHPAAAYVGIRRLDRLVRVGDKLPLEIIAVTPEGKAFSGPLKLSATLSREINEQVRVQNIGGRSAVRNEARHETLSTTQLELADSKGSEFLFAPQKSGLHTLEIRGIDVAGHPFATATTIHVYGSDEYPWAYEDSMRIKLVPEKKLYRPGDTARVLVLSPIEGTALVTLEREQVTRSFLVDLKATEPVIEIPLSDADAPNCYVSVMVIKGAQDSLRKHKEPQLRLGYCELKVENLRDRLTLTLETLPQDSTVSNVSNQANAPKESLNYVPGSEITITGTVSLSNNKPAANAEITLYAEDEGTLAVLGYITPNPMDFFYNPRLLRVECGTSLGNFIPEDPDEQTFYNKGFFIGGGGGEYANALESTRRDFNPCAFWKPSLRSDAQGRFTATVKLPDTLTRYRLIAVANQNTTRFGHAESSFIVSKQLMIEPQAPRFASETDTLQVQALVTNASNYDGTWRITFTSNPPASEPIAVIANSSTAGGDSQSAIAASQEISLAAGKSTSVTFPVTFKNTGEATFHWKAEPTFLPDRDRNPLHRILSDSVEATFQVEYPVPLLRQTRLIKLERRDSPLDLLQSFDPELLNGRGRIEIEISRSLLLEAGGAVDFLLRYPYGCLEQTTSALIPWLAVEQLRSVSPALAKHTPKEVKKAIQSGIDRLLSMQQRDGGFSYWNGGTESVPWASSYAGLGLILASEQGSVPPAAIESLSDYLIGQLRDSGKSNSPQQLEVTARNLWVLALIGHPQDAYVNKLKDRLSHLNSRARSMLALAETSVGHDKAARSILLSKTRFTAKDDSWMRWQPDHAFTLLAWSTLDPQAEQTTRAIDRMLRDRNPYGHWNTTWCNAWSVIALSSYAESIKDLSPTTLTLIGDTNESFTVGTKTPSLGKSITLTSGLKLAVIADGDAYIRINLAAKPKIAPIQPVAHNGLEITRFYQLVHNDGSTEPLGTPKLGDLIRVDLRVTLPHDDLRYLVVEDRIPALFEAINNSFQSQAAPSIAGGTSERSWSVSHSELRADRAYFFLDRGWNKGTYTLTYLVRCTQAGQAIAPPAKVESMYDPENTALSASRNFKTSPNH